MKRNVHRVGKACVDDSGLREGEIYVGVLRKGLKQEITGQ